MRKFTTLAEFDAHIESTPYPRLLTISARARMKTVEECNEGGAQAVLIIAETPDDAVAIANEYRLTDIQPEDYSIFGTEGQVWHEAVYVLGDDGGGVVVYTKLHER